MRKYQALHFHYVKSIRLSNLVLTIFLLSIPVIVKAGNHNPKMPPPQFYVTPTGTAAGDGSSGNPWDLQTALNQPAGVIPGSIICLAAGTYAGNFTSSLTGTAADPIVLKNCSGGRVVIDGSRAGQLIKNVPTLMINGAYTWYMGLEITNSDPERIITQSGSNPPERRGPGLSIFGTGTKLINCLIYDNGEGIDAWSTADNSEFYGNVVFDNGWYAPDRHHGHGIYTQNNGATKKFINNISLNNFSYGWQVFGSSAASLNNYYLEGNIVFNNRWLIGGSAPLHNIELYKNFTYRDTIQLGYDFNVLNTGLVLRGNYFPSLVKIYYWNDAIVKSNTLFADSSYHYPVLLDFQGTPNLTNFQFDSNQYYWSTPSPSYQSEPGVGWENNTLDASDPLEHGTYLLSAWQGVGQEMHASVQHFPYYDDSSFDLSGNRVFLLPNVYDAKRANLLIYNWNMLNNVDVDVSGILNAGDHYELHNVLNYFNDVVSGTYLGGMLSVPMTGHSVAFPLGYPLLLGESTFPGFGSFILLNTSTGSVLPVHFTSFTASSVNKQVLLQWTTEQEQNVSQYIIERSVNGQDFTPIATVAASGNPGVTNHYQYNDGAPFKPVSYYRIREVETSNQHTYSSIQKVMFKQGLVYSIKPNPATDVLQVNLNLPLHTDRVELLLRDASGMLLLSRQQAVSQQDLIIPLDISKFPKGNYFLTIKTPAETVTTQFLKQ